MGARQPDFIVWSLFIAPAVSGQLGVATGMVAVWKGA